MVFMFISGNSAWVVNAQELNDTAVNDTLAIIIEDTISATVNNVDAVAIDDTIAAIVNDTIYIEPADSTVEILNKEDTLALKEMMTGVPSFKPIPKRAVLYSAIFPGLGQIYNRKYWKLPIVYGGVMGFAYAISWNNKTYQDYNKAYLDFYHDSQIKNDPDDWYGSWKDFVPAGVDDPDEYINNSSFEQSLKSRTNYYRRYRDLSIILAVAWYFLCIADSYVDAQLFDFDITPDLSMRVEPVVTPRTKFTPDLFGLSCCIKF